jgi:glycosyltransferase involved in cell wall biosynthesis
MDTEKNFSTDMHIACVTRMGGNTDSFIGKGGDRIMEILSRFEDKQKNMAFSTEFDGYKELIDKHLINVDYRANISHDEVGRLFARSHISLHCSRCEACQMTLVESMYARTVPVTYGVGVAKELINQGKNGFIISSPDEAEAVIKELYLNPSKACEIADRARETIKQLSIKKTGSKYQEVLRKIVQNRS